MAALIAVAACASVAPPSPGVQHLSVWEGHQVDYVRVATRPGVVQGFQFIQVAQPRASVVLFSGGSGTLPPSIRQAGRGIGAGGRPERPNRSDVHNFLVRERADLVDAGFNVALVDVPSDRRDLDFFRTSAAHAQDVQGIIEFLRRAAPVPVWLIGTSRGTVSAASAAARLHPGPDGLILSSTIFESFGSETSVYNVDLDAIAVPTLLVHHRQDGCRVTPARGVPILAEHLRHAPKVEQALIQGGNPSLTSECEPGSPHGYFGVEDEAVAAMIAFIKANPPRGGNRS